MTGHTRRRFWTVTLATAALLVAGVLSGGAEPEVDLTIATAATPDSEPASASFTMLDPRVPPVIRELRETGMNDDTPVVTVTASRAQPRVKAAADDAAPAAPKSSPTSIAAGAPAPAAAQTPIPVPDRVPPPAPWIVTWGTTQEQHDQGARLTDGTTIPASAFFYLVDPDATSPPADVRSVFWQTNLDTGYQDDGYPWRWVITGAPPGTHWVEATINGETKIRTSFQIAGTTTAATLPGSAPPTTVAPPATIAPPTTISPPAPAPPPPTPVQRPAPNDGAMTIGPGFVSSTLNARGTNANYRLAIPWTATHDGVVTAFATYWTHSIEGSYYQGDGGVQVVSLRPDNNGVPGDTVLGELRLNRPCAPGGAFAPCGGYDNAHTLGFLPLSSTAQVVDGARYWWHFENQHPDSHNNWTGIDGLSDATGPYDDFPQLYENDGRGWRPASNAHIGRQTINSRYWPDGYIDFTDSTFAPIYAVKYSDGSLSSQSPYAEANTALEEFGGDTVIYQQIQVPGGVLQEVWIYADHRAGSDTLTLTINGAAYQQSGDGWLKYTPNVAVGPGLVTMEFSGTGTWWTRAQWRWWPGAAEWGGGGHYGTLGNKWDVWDAQRPVDLPFLARIETS